MATPQTIASPVDLAAAWSDAPDRVRKLVALEESGQADQAARLLDEMLASSQPEAARSAWLALGLVNIARGITALATVDIATLEQSIKRFIEVEELAKAQGFPEALEAALQVYRSAFAEDFPAALATLGAPRPATAAAQAELKSWLEQLNQATGGQARDHFEEFDEGIMLFRIEDPFERWRVLGDLISLDWPEGLTAEEAVRQVRGCDHD